MDEGLLLGNKEDIADLLRDSARILNQTCSNS